VHAHGGIEQLGNIFSVLGASVFVLYHFNCWDISTPQDAAYSTSLFQSGWFLESLLTQTLIILVIRTNKIALLQSRSSWPVLVMSLVIMAIGIAIPFSPLGPTCASQSCRCFTGCSWRERCCAMSCRHRV
jgi:magnesium-transporting ATPase (P-type)